MHWELCVQCGYCVAGFGEGPGQCTWNSVYSVASVWQGLVKDLGNALGTLQRNLELLEQTMENLAETVAELEDFLLIVDNLMFSE